MNETSDSIIVFLKISGDYYDPNNAVDVASGPAHFEVLYNDIPLLVDNEHNPKINAQLGEVEVFQFKLSSTSTHDELSIHFSSHPNRKTMPEIIEIHAGGQLDDEGDFVNGETLTTSLSEDLPGTVQIDITPLQSVMQVTDKQNEVSDTSKDTHFAEVKLSNDDLQALDFTINDIAENEDTEAQFTISDEDKVSLDFTLDDIAEADHLKADLDKLPI